MSVSEASVGSGNIAEDSVDSGALTEGERRFNDTARPGLTPQQCISKYDAWATSYDKDIDGEFNGPKLAAKAVGELYPPCDRANKLILDVAAGTGLVGQGLVKLGFKKLHALDPSQGMLEVARQKNIYEKYICSYVDHNPLPIDDNTYDCVVCCGAFCPAHIPVVGLLQLQRVVKPGGFVVLLFREEYLTTVPEYRGKLETFMKDMEQQGKWKQTCRRIMSGYSFRSKDGLLVEFVVH